MRAVRAEHLHGAADYVLLGTIGVETGRNDQRAGARRVNRQKGAFEPAAGRQRCAEIRRAADQDTVRIKHLPRLSGSGEFGRNWTWVEAIARGQSSAANERTDLRDRRRAGDVYGDDTGVNVRDGLRPGLPPHGLAADG